MADSSLWHYRHGGEEKGPVPFSSLKDLAAAGQLAPADPVRPRDGGGDWRPAGDVPGLFPGGADDTTTTPPTPTSTG